MLRYLNVLAIAALVGSAVYAYSIKYETMLFSAQIGKSTRAIEREHDAIGRLRAEWAYLTRPERVQALAERHLDLQPQALAQIVRLSDLPERAAQVDAIGRKLEALGLAEPTATPQDPRGGATTPNAPVLPGN
jgi:cell division protein FtsL